MNFPHLVSPLTAGGFRGESAEAAIAQGHPDAVAFGRIFISNPDLPSRLRHGHPLAPYDRKTFMAATSPAVRTIPSTTRWIVANRLLGPP